MGRPGAPGHPTARRLGRVLLIALLAGVIVAGGFLLLALLVGGDRTPDLDQSLARRSIPSLGFSVSVPQGWTSSEEDLDGLRSVRYQDPDVAGGEKGFRVVVDSFEFALVADTVQDVLAEQYPGYTRGAVSTNERVDNQPAVVHEFRSEGLEYEQWWIKRQSRTFRLEMWAPVGDLGARDLNDEIVSSFRIL